jgi:hypothetical protein
VQLSQNNAIWAESIYLRGFNPTTGEKLTYNKIYDYAKILKANRIKYLYLFAGPFGIDGHIPEYPFSVEAIETVKTIKKLYPEIKILPWVGGIQNKTVYLDDSLWVKNALYDTKKLVNTLRCEGVHIDLEFILKEDKYLAQEIIPEKKGDLESYGSNVNEFHKKLRELIPDSFISSVVTATSKDTKPWKRKTSISELMEVSYFTIHISTINLFSIRLALNY